MRRVLVALVLVLVAVVTVASCSGASEPDTSEPETEPSSDIGAPRRYAASWLIDTGAVDLEFGAGVPSPMLYREVIDDVTGTYLVEGPNHLALQHPDEVVFCAAIARVPLRPYCAAAPRADGTPNVLAYPIQLLRGDWSPSALYDLAGYREVALVAASDPDAWATQTTTNADGVTVDCFLAIGETSAAVTGFEICFTADDLHLVASVDLQSDLLFEIELIDYQRGFVADEFETGLEEFYEGRPALQEQLLDIYPDIPVARPTPTPG